MRLGLIIGLTLIGSMSPLLTSAYLWQLKEWRWDRLLEHLRREGWFLPLFGHLRPALTALFYAELLLPGMPQVAWLLSTLTAFAALTIVQAVFARQRFPVATQKALALITGAFAWTAAIAFLLLMTGWGILLPLLMLLQPVALALSWLLFLPVDRFLKQRIMDRARRLRAAHPELAVIGITGSVGKTTTKELIAHVLGDRATATPAYVNSEMGVARWLLKVLSVSSSTLGRPAPTPRTPSPVGGGGQGVGAGVSTGEQKPQILVIEMGAYRRGEIALLCSIARPTMGVVTYVGNQHLALFGSPEALFQAKSELILSLPPDGHAFLNGDNDGARRMKDLAPCPVTVVGTGGEADLEAFDIEETATGIRFRSLDTVFELPLHGTHNVVNALLAIAIARSLGLEPPVIRERLRGFRPPSHTFAVREERGVTILDDTHNSSPASVKAAIAWARTQPFDSKTLLMSGLIELGEEQERAHMGLGGIAAEVFDRVIMVDEQAAVQFERGFGKPVEGWRKGEVEKVPAGSLLVCVGRMPLERMSAIILPG